MGPTHSFRFCNGFVCSSFVRSCKQQRKELAQTCPAAEDRREKWNIPGGNIETQKRDIAPTVKEGYLFWYSCPDGEIPNSGYLWHMLYNANGKVEVMSEIRIRSLIHVVLATIT